MPNPREYLSSRRNEEGVSCLVCGLGPYVILGQHLRRTHGISRKDYLREYPNAEMIPASIREALLIEAAEKGWHPGSKRRNICKRGHPLKAGNLRRNPRGKRQCLQCYRESQRAYEQRVRERRGLRPCECGCGRETYTRFLKGHNRRKAA